MCFCLPWTLTFRTYGHVIEHPFNPECWYISQFCFLSLVLGWHFETITSMTLDCHRLCFNPTLSNFIQFYITLGQLSIQEAIDAYLSSCRRSRSSSSAEDDKDSDDEEDDDPQTNQEFADFKKWLDEATPCSEASSSPPVPTTCAKCGCEKCEWTSIKFMFQKIFQQNEFGLSNYQPWNRTYICRRAESYHDHLMPFTVPRRYSRSASAGCPQFDCPAAGRAEEAVGRDAFLSFAG